jgi:EthD domain
MTMIKCLFMIHRAPQLSLAEFADYWERIHSRMAIANAPQLRMRRYVQNHRRDHEIAGLFQQGRGCVMGEFDGVAEAWWDSFEDMAAAAGETPEEVAAAILQDEARFVDLRRSVIWFGEEKPFWPVESATGSR